MGVLNKWDFQREETPLDVAREINEEDDGETAAKSSTRERKENSCGADDNAGVLLEEMVFMGADERPGQMTKSAAKRFKPLRLEETDQ